MKDNLYKFLKFLNRNKYIAVFFVFVLSFFAFKNIAFAGSCSLTNIGACFDEIVGGILTSIALFFISFSAFIFGLAFPVFLNITGWLLNSGPINTAWILVRDLVNMFFIFFLLFTSLAKLVGQEKKLAQHSASKQIVYILLSAFLINFSKVICGIVVDIAQIVMLQFTNAFVDSLQNLNSLFKVPGGATPSILLGIIFIVFALAFLATALTSLLYILIRAVSLGIYAALSPLWFLWLSFPTKSKGIDQIKSETMDKFFEAAIGGPILAFYLWISLMLINTGSDGSLTDNVNNAGTGTKLKTYSTGDSQSTDAMASVATDTNSATILKMIVASAVLLFANKQAMSMAKKGGTVIGHGVMNGVVDKVGQNGMKPLDGLKNTASSIAKDTVGNVKDTVGGGIRNGINLARSGNNGLSKILDSGFKTKENMATNAIARQGRISERASQAKALESALKSGNLESIKKTKDAISTRQINQGKKVKANIDAEGGLGNYVGNRAKKYGKIAAVTGAALATGGITLPFAMGVGATTGAVLTGVGAAGALGKFGINGFNRQNKAENEKTRLEALRTKMNNNPESFTEANVGQVTAEIWKQEAIIKAEKERQKLADYKNSNSNPNALKKELKSIPTTEKINVNIKELNDRNNGISETVRQLTDELGKGTVAENEERKETIKKLNEEFKKNNEAIKNNEAKNERRKDLENLIKSSPKTADEVAKQEAIYTKAEAGVSKADKNIDTARDKAANIEKEKEKSTAQKVFADAQDKVKATKQYMGDFEHDASKIDLYNNYADESGKVTGNINEVIAALLAKAELVKKGATNWTKSEELVMNDPKNQAKFKAAIEKLDTETIAKFNAVSSQTGLSNISAKSEEVAKDRIAKMFEDLKEYKDKLGKNETLFGGAYKELKKRAEDLETSLNDTNEGDLAEIYRAIQAEKELSKRVVSNGKGATSIKEGSALDSKDYHGDNSYGDTLSRLREAKETTVISAPAPDVKTEIAGIEADQSGVNKVSLDESSMRSLAVDIATNMSKISSGNNNNNQSAAMEQFINSNEKLASHLDTFANSISMGNNDFIKSSLGLVSEIKDEKQKEAALTVIMEKVMNKVNNPQVVEKAFLTSVNNSEAKGHYDIVQNAYIKAKNNFRANEVKSQERAEEIEDYMDNGFPRT